MDLSEVARRQGPRAHRSVLLLGLVGLIGGLTIASVRILRDGRVGAGSLLWIAFALVWACGFAAVEILANRSLRRAAVREMPDGADVILFRVGQLADLSSDETRQVGKGWIGYTAGELWVYARRDRALIAHSTSDTERSARVETAPGSYGVLEVSIGVDRLFGCIPVEVGLHNVGLNSDRVRALSRSISTET